MNSQTVICDISGNAETLQPVLALIAIEDQLSRSSRLLVIVSSFSVIKRMLQMVKHCRFVLTSYQTGQGGRVCVELRPGSKRELLVISRYRCPGPIVEIMAALRGLEADTTLELILFGDDVNTESLEHGLIARNYVVTDKVMHGSVFYKCSVSASRL